MNFADYLNEYAATAANVYGAVTQNKQATAAPTPVATVSTSPQWQKYIPLGIGAVVVIALLVFLKK